MGEDLLDHLDIRAARNDPHRPAAGRAGLIGYIPVAVAACWLPLPRFAGVTRARTLLCGANTP